MPKGTRGGKRSGGGLTKYADQITIGTDAIEYEGDFVFTGKDPSLTDAQRAAFDAWETKRVKNKIEFGTAVNGRGVILGEKKGGRGSVSTPSWWLNDKDGAFNHIHPRERGILGGTFSYEDLRNWANFPVKTFRATAKEGTYSISKRADFNRHEFKKFYSQSVSKWENWLSNEGKQLRANVRSGKIPITEYSKRSNKMFNTMLIGLHNDLLANQSKYGYNYYLEKR